MSVPAAAPAASPPDAALPARALPPLGILAGAALGALAGLAETIASPLGEPLRIPYAVGADGLLGAAGGLLASTLVLARPALRRTGLPAVAGALAALIAFPALAAALGLFANRVLLSGTHFLGARSLAADAVALLAAAGLAAWIGRAVRGTLVRREARRAPSPLLALAAVALLTAAWRLPSLALDRGGVDVDRPDIVLISIDTLRPDRLSAQGFPLGTSPEIDRLLAEGALYPEAVAASPGSAASHAALLTARYPISNGVWANFSVLDESVTTLAEILARRGYRTGGFVTNTFLGRQFRFDQGFGTYVESGVVERLEEPSAAGLHRSLVVVQIVDRLRGRFDPGSDPSFDTALAWLRESRRPTFAFVHLMDVHSPYVPPPPYGPLFGADPGGGPGAPAHRNRFGWRPSEEAYLAEIRFADTKIGRLRRLLEELGTLDDAVVVLTSDHGENLLDHEPHFSHGSTLYDATLRILTGIRAPGLVAPRTLDAGVLENVDVFPSVFALLGWKSFPEWEGRGVAPGAPRSPADVTISQLNRDFAIRARDWKVIRRETGERWLHRLDLDPAEQTTHPPPDELLLRSEAAFKAWFDSTATALYEERASRVAPEELSPELLEKLRTLGYVE